jgi:midasin
MVCSETRKLFQPLMRVLSRIQQLLELTEFQHNQVLYNLALLCNFVLELEFCQTPLSKLITGVQFILEKCEEWDRSVPLIYGLRQESVKLEDLLLRWRRMERSGWRIMLELREDEVQKQDAVMFLKLRTVLQELMRAALRNLLKQQKPD